MKYIIIAILTVTLISCGTTQRKQPTPFTTTEKTLKLKGCVDLHKAVKVWNKANPDKKPKKADC